jgi:hypothetical protein
MAHGVLAQRGMKTAFAADVSRILRPLDLLVSLIFQQLGGVSFRRTVIRLLQPGGGKCKRNGVVLAPPADATAR